MQAKRRVTHERDVNPVLGAVDLGLVVPVVIHRAARDVTDRFAGAHRMHEPVWASRPSGYKTVVGRERCAENVVLVIPITEPRTEEKVEHAANVAVHHLDRGAFIIEAGIAEAADAGVAASAGT